MGWDPLATIRAYGAWQRGQDMDYYLGTKTSGEFDEVVGKVKEALKAEGFGILTEIDVRATLKKKLNVDFRPYVILGACNPPFAYKALSVEDKIGTMLPCNVVVQQSGGDLVEVAAVDPVASMLAVDNPAIQEVAKMIRAKLQVVITRLS